MKRRGKIRLGVIILFGILFGVYFQHDDARWRRLGRDAFLAHQGSRFDMNIAAPRPLFLHMFGGAVVAVLLFGSYECVVLLLSVGLRSAPPEGKNQSEHDPSGSPGQRSAL
jgi:hypothetical protein